MTRFLVLLLFLAPAALAQGTLEVIPLRHRTVEQVLPVLRPLLEPGGAGGSSARTESGILSSRQGTAVDERRIRVKVEELRN